MINSVVKPLLTIAIPSYNHHEMLAKQIRLLLPQLTNEVVLLVRDNHSNPSVTEYLRNEGLLSEQYTITTNPSNVGSDGNVLGCMQDCATDWLWVLSDNDYVSTNAVSKVLKLIKETKASYINTNCMRSAFGQGFFEFCEKIEYANSFSISNCLYKMKDIRKYLPFYEQSIETHQGQGLLVFKFFAENELSFFHLTEDKFIDYYLPAEWPKAAFARDTSHIYHYLKKGLKKKYYVYFRKTVAHQVLAMQLHSVIIARSYQKMNVKNYLFLLLNILSVYNVKSWLSAKRLLWESTSTLFFPAYVASKRRKALNQQNDFSISDNSKNMTWGEY